MFGYARGELKNVGIENCNVSGAGDVGGLVGNAYRGDITNSYATGDVTGYNNVGGLVGSAFCDITNSYATGDVSGANDIGGLVGYEEGDITNSYATGDVTGEGEQVGGLAGYEEGYITNSYATGDVSGDSDVGGLAGRAFRVITNSYATGDVTGNYDVGGLVGWAGWDITNSTSYSDNVTGTNRVGSFVGYLSGTTITDCKCRELAGLPKIGDGSTPELEANIAYTTEPAPTPTPTPTPMGGDITFQVGIKGNKDSQISINTTFDITGVENFRNIGLDRDTDFLSQIDSMLSKVSSKQTDFGAVQNRLDSALEEIGTHIENLTSSRSTLKDADIAKESSEYIRGQILQQASATLLATANQSPAIALTLLTGIR